MINYQISSYKRRLLLLIACKAHLETKKTITPLFCNIWYAGPWPDIYYVMIPNTCYAPVATLESTDLMCSTCVSDRKSLVVHDHACSLVRIVLRQKKHESLSQKCAMSFCQALVSDDIAAAGASANLTIIAGS